MIMGSRSALAMLIAVAAIAGCSAFVSQPHSLSLGVRSRNSQCPIGALRMGIFSTNDLPPYAPKLLFSRRLARLVDKNGIQKAAAKLISATDKALTEGEELHKEGKVNEAKTALEAALANLEKMGTPPTQSLGLTSLPGRAFELRRVLNK